MMLAERAFEELFPGKSLGYIYIIFYSGRFRGFNANVRLNRFTKTVTFNLSRQWRTVDEEIKLGLLQDMILRIFKKKGKTVNMDLYHNFIRSVHVAIPKTKSHPLLEESFNRVNALFFSGFVEKPNLVVGKDNIRTMGHYNYGTDTITISSVLLNHIDLLDYVMYHEVLHKKDKFSSKNGRNLHHSSKFRFQEHSYPNSRELEEKLSRIVRKKKWFSLFGL
jgi:hypothetical protein